MNNKIKILYVSGGPLDLGGITTWLYNYISNINFEIFDVSILVHGGVGVREKTFLDLGINIYHVPFLKDSLFKYKKQVLAVINNNYDIIHSHMDAANSRFFRIVKKRCNSICVSHVHSVYYVKTDFKHKIYHNVLKKNLMKNSDFLFACSKDAGLFYYDKSPFIVIPNAINSKEFSFNQKERDDLRSKLGINNNCIAIGQIGHVNENKNQLFFLDVLNNLLTTNSNYFFIVLGDGNLSDLIDKAKKLNILNNIIFINSQKEISKFYNIFDILVQPSIKEGLSLTCLEGQYNSLNVIASTGVPEEVCISSKFIRLPLEVEIWSKYIKNLKIERKVTKNFFSNNYDIFFAKSLLENFYINCLNNRT